MSVLVGCVVTLAVEDRLYSAKIVDSDDIGVSAIINHERFSIEWGDLYGGRCKIISVVEEKHREAA